MAYWEIFKPRIEVTYGKGAYYFDDLHNFEERMNRLKNDSKNNIIKIYYEKQLHSEMKHNNDEDFDKIIKIVKPLILKAQKERNNNVIKGMKDLIKNNNNMEDLWYLMEGLNYMRVI